MGSYSAKVTTDNVVDLTATIVNHIMSGVSKYGAVQVELTRVTRSIAQNSLWHAQIGEIAKQAKFGNSELTASGAKEYLMLVFAFEMEREGTPLTQGITQIPSRKTEGGWMPVPPKTSKLTIDEGSNFIEWLFAYGAERSVRFNDDVTRQYEAYIGKL